MGKKVLVTGGTGYIGSCLVLTLLKQDQRVVIIDDLSNSSSSVVTYIEQISGRTCCEVFYVDLKDATAVNSVFSSNPDISTVVHLAGLDNARSASQDPLSFYDSNVGGTINLLKAMKTFGVTNIIFASSWNVYGGELVCKDVSYNMDEGSCQRLLADNLNVYGSTKLMIERILSDLCKSDTKWRATVLRLFTVFGAEHEGYIGDNPTNRDNLSLLQIVAEVATGKRQFLNVFGMDYYTKDKTCVRDYVHISDVVDAFICSINKEWKPSENRFNTFNICRGLGISILDIVKMMESVSGKPIPIRICDERNGDVGSAVGRCDESKRGLNWEPRFGLKEMCESEWRWNQYASHLFSTQKE